MTCKLYMGIGLHKRTYVSVLEAYRYSSEDSTGKLLLSKSLIKTCWEESGPLNWPVSPGAQMRIFIVAQTLYT